MKDLRFDISCPSYEIRLDLEKKINQKTKPLGALGRLEGLALQVGIIQQSLNPSLKKPHFFVFAADHGIAQSKVSQYPQEVTYQMVKNFLSGGAAINVFCKQHNIDLSVVDAGIIGKINTNNRAFKDCKITEGTKSFLNEPAMTEEECIKAVKQGSKVAKEAIDNGTNIIGIGEMGISNTSSAAIILHLITRNPLDECVGRGTGLSDEGIRRKTKILHQAVGKYHQVRAPMDILQTFGGFEIAHMVGAILQAAESEIIVVVDGFIATAAALIAYELYPTSKEYMIFSHQSDEYAHTYMLEHLKAMPLLRLGMRLGEGTGAAIAYPLIESAVLFLNEMASFEEAKVSNSEKK